MAAQISLAPLREALVQQLIVALPPAPGSPLGRTLAALTGLLGANPGAAWPSELAVAGGLRTAEVLRQLRMAYASAGSCVLDCYLAGNGSTSTTVRLLGATGSVELTLDITGSGELVRAAISLGGL